MPGRLTINNTHRDEYLAALVRGIYHKMLAPHWQALLGHVTIEICNLPFNWLAQFSGFCKEQEEFGRFDFSDMYLICRELPLRAALCGRKEPITIYVRQSQDPALPLAKTAHEITRALLEAFFTIIFWRNAPAIWELMGRLIDCAWCAKKKTAFLFFVLGFVAHAAGYKKRTKAWSLMGPFIKRLDAAVARGELRRSIA